jgi:beta-galactosidase
MKYLGYGPKESYEDKRRAARLSFFETTVKDNFEHYIKPQENGAHYDTRVAAVSDNKTSLVISSDSFSFSASPYSSLELMNTAHDFELKSKGQTVVNIDYRNSAIGSASCGPKLMTKYRFDEREFSFSFRLRLCDKGSFSPEKEF